MKELIEKRWYIGLVIIPLLYDLITKWIGLDNLVLSKSTFIIISLSVIIISLILEIVFLNKEKANLEGDKIKANRLYRKLSSTHFINHLKNHDHNHGYNYDLFETIEDFVISFKDLDNRILNKKLNAKFLCLYSVLESYWKYSSENLITEKNGPFTYIGLPRELLKENDELYQKKANHLNELSTKAYKELEKLIAYMDNNSIIIHKL